MVQIPVYKDYDMNQAYPFTRLAGEDAEKIFTPLFEEDSEGEKMLRDGCFEMGDDAKTVVLIWDKAPEEIPPTEFHELRIKAGDGVFAVRDMSVMLMKGSVVTVTPEAGRFKHTTGEHKGKVILSPVSGELYVAVFEAP